MWTAVKSFAGDLPWKMIGAAVIALAFVALIVRGEILTNQRDAAKSDSAKWESLAGTMTEAANENAKVAQAARDQATEAEAVAEKERKRAAAANRNYEALREAVRHAATNDALTPGVRAAIAGLPE